LAAGKDFIMSESIKATRQSGGIYFPNLNGLRFVAALLVIIHHIEQIKSIYSIENNWGSGVIQILGEQGVSLFFVLSGFLITYLLLEEEKQTGAIKLKDFYVRRILRIWPLYFSIGFLALVVLPRIPLFIMPGAGHDFIYRHLSTKIVLFVLFLPNLLPYLGGIIPYASQTWSIGTEEQFYLMWPLLMKNIKKHRIVLMLLIIAGYIIAARALWSSHTDFLPFKYYISGFWSLFNIDLMAIGGLLAILLHAQNKYLKFIRNNVVFYVSLLVVFYMFKEAFMIQHVYKEIYAVLYGIIILNFASNPNIHFSLEAGVFKYLGKISYGLYMYHPIAIVLAVHLAKWTGLINNAFIYPASIMLAIVLAGLSYKYMESFFLKLKLNYSTVRSGDDIPSDQKEPIQLKKAIP
jgi:peptidoglycan/LPS O-acetylase OafA/YrhL